MQILGGTKLVKWLVEEKSEATSYTVVSKVILL